VVSNDSQGHTQWCWLTFSIFKVFCELLLGSRASAVALTADIVEYDMYESVYQRVWEPQLASNGVV